jgi:hydroxyacylglutathione hydrolase
MTAEIRVFRCLSDNIGALIHDPATGACAAIDAPEEGPILSALQETGWTLSDILVTHRHADHVQGIEPLKQRFGCRVVAPAKAGGQVPAVDAYVREGDTVRVGELSAHVWETPGHCADHIAYWFAADRALFAGDTLFTLGCGRVMESSFAEMWNSLSRLAALPGEARVYSGHDYVIANANFALAADPDNAALKARAAEAEKAAAEGRFLIPSTIGEEKATNPFLRAGEPALARSVKMEGADPAAVFQALREWKNRF